MKEYIVQERLPLKEFLDNYVPAASFVYRRLVKDREIKVNGQRIDKNIQLEIGDKVQLYLTKKEEALCLYTILYEDENFCIVDKASGVNAEGVFHTLQEEKRVFFIHRLDRNTAGLMLFAKTQEAERALLSAFRNGKIEKEYHAMCLHPFTKKHAVEVAYLKKDRQTATVSISMQKAKGYQKIVTEYSVLKEYNAYAHLKILLHTGKTHQIRAHMAALGHPILGDEKYGDKYFNQKYHVKRQILVAKKLVCHLPDFPKIDKKSFYSHYDVQC